MNRSKQMDLILELLYKADALARKYPEALRGDLTFDLSKLISLIEESQFEVVLEELYKEPA
jgi:hypothetical protein